MNTGSGEKVEETEIKTTDVLQACEDFVSTLDLDYRFKQIQGCIRKFNGLEHTALINTIIKDSESLLSDISLSRIRAYKEITEIDVIEFAQRCAVLGRPTFCKQIVDLLGVLQDRIDKDLPSYIEQISSELNARVDSRIPIVKEGEIQNFVRMITIKDTVLLNLDFGEVLILASLYEVHMKGYEFVSAS